MAAGRKTGGRREGTPNKATAERAAALQAATVAVTDALTPAQIERLQPKDLMLRIMRLAVREGAIGLALAAAKEAAPYCHAKLANVILDATFRRSIAELSDEELADLGSEDGGEAGTGEAEAGEE